SMEKIIMKQNKHPETAVTTIILYLILQIPHFRFIKKNDYYIKIEQILFYLMYFKLCPLPLQQGAVRVILRQFRHVHQVRLVTFGTQTDFHLFHHREAQHQNHALLGASDSDERSLLFVYLSVFFLLLVFDS